MVETAIAAAEQIEDAQAALNAPRTLDETVVCNRRIRGLRGPRLMRRRGELIERSFAHLYNTGGMRRTHLRVTPTSSSSR
jgi:hypothetical protein